jgi:hypothetical protein
MKPLDLDALQELDATGWSAPWAITGAGAIVRFHGEHAYTVIVEAGLLPGHHERLAIVGSRNALPALIAEVRRLRKVAEAAALAEEFLTSNITHTPVVDIIDALDAALAEWSHA